MRDKGINEIVLQNVNFSYEKDHLLYDQGINARFVPGRVYLLSGRNGCGKSTLVNILLKIWKNYSGEIYLDGKEHGSFSRADISHKIGLSFQKTPIFHDTIRNNISLGKSGNIEKLVSVLGFDHDLQMMGRNLDSWIKDVSSLSGGQAQKLGILRTLFCDKSVYIFDEATANLDCKAKKEFFTMVERMKKDHIILLISHEEDIDQYIDEKIEIKGGRETCI